MSQGEGPGIWQSIAVGLWGVLVTIGSGAVGFVWKKHDEEMKALKGAISQLNEKLDSSRNHYVPMSVYETNRQEMRQGQIDIFRRLDTLGQSLARIEGKLDK